MCSHTWMREFGKEYRARRKKCCHVLVRRFWLKTRHKQFPHLQWDALTWVPWFVDIGGATRRQIRRCTGLIGKSWLTPKEKGAGFLRHSCLINNPESLYAWVLRAKYFPNGDVCCRKKMVTNMSYTWRSIMKGIEVLNRGVIWRIWNGRNDGMWLVEEANYS